MQTFEPTFASHATDPRSPRLQVAKLAALTIDERTVTDVTLAGHAYGPPLGSAPVLVVVGGITASALPFGKANGADDGSTTAAQGWWSALDDPELVDLEHTTVLCPAWPGSGSSWADFGAVPGGLSVLGLADLIAAWLDGIGCDAPVDFLGASLGGLVALAFAARHPARCSKVVSISAGLRPDGWGTAVRHLQRELVRDAIRRGDAASGMSHARQLGMLTYRSRDELETRFGKLVPHLERPPVASYLEHHGQRFAREFSAETFLLLSEAIDRCQLGATDAEVASALARIQAEVVVVGVPGDMLFPWPLQVELHRALRASGVRSSLWRLDSQLGHDAFLADQRKLAELLRTARAFAGSSPASSPRLREAREPLREVRVGMIGCGTVGTGLLELLERQRASIGDRFGVDFRVTRIAVRDVGKPRTPLAGSIPITDDPLALVTDPEVDVLVEVAGGEAMDPILRSALAAGKPVVTANKLVLATKLTELSTLATRAETPLYCEAAAAAAIPILRHLSHRADEIDGFSAILNGTTNYVLTRMEQDELPLAEAVRRAQELGFAEADPRADLQGDDAAAKLSILAYRAFGVWHRPGSFPVRGITELEPVDFELAAAMGFRIRSIARARRRAERLELAVEPMLLPAWHLLASVEEEYNAVYLECRASGDLSLFGKGAGGLPTATAVLGDLVDLAQGNSVAWPAPELATETVSSPRRRYVRITVDAHGAAERSPEAHLRRHGLDVLNRAFHREGEHDHFAFVTAACDDAAAGAIERALEQLGRVRRVRVISVADGSI